MPFNARVGYRFRPGGVLSYDQVSSQGARGSGC